MTMRKNREEWKIHGNVFDQFTEGVLQKLEAQGLFDHLVNAIALGKEANIFTAQRGDSFVIVKIYRLENCNFKKMYEYLKQDPRYMHTKPAKRATVFAWAQREYRNLFLAREAVPVPAPLGHRDNVLVLSLIGDEERGVAARQLKDQQPENPATYAQMILAHIKELWKHGLVHGDLSAFNILNKDDRPVFIDFSQASPTSAPNAKELLTRDLKNLAQHFKKLDVTLDEEKELKRILK